MFDIDTLDIDELERLRDAVNRRILEMRRTKGLALPELLRLLDEVKATLNDQGKEWYSLERWQYMDGEIRFWLNPKAHEIYNTGWFSIDDLIAWGRESGPVVHQEYFEDEDEAGNEVNNGITWLTSEERQEQVEVEDNRLRFQRFEP